MNAIGLSASHFLFIFYIIFSMYQSNTFFVYRVILFVQVLSTNSFITCRREIKNINVYVCVCMIKKFHEISDKDKSVFFLFLSDTEEA